MLDKWLPRILIALIVIIGLLQMAIAVCDFLIAMGYS